MTRRPFISQGHLIDSGILTSILNIIIEEGADYQIVNFEIGKTNDQVSKLEIDLLSDSEEQLEQITEKLVQNGCYEKRPTEAVFKKAEKDCSVSDDFYSTTNHRTEVFINNRWHEVHHQRMDAVIVSENNTLYCKKLRDIKKGDMVLCGSESVRVFPPPRDRYTDVFGFMANDVSSERSVSAVVKKIAEEMKIMTERGEKIVAVAGPVTIHTGGSSALSALIREGYIHGILAGNALAVHDLESEFFGTSLGIDMEHGKPTHEGNRNHMRAINRVNYYGSIRNAIDAGALKKGTMYEILQSGIPYCLAGSIRDDGPLPETETDMIKAQNDYADIIKGSSMVLMLSTMLHSIGTGNMLPSWVKTVCVDINPAVVTKLSDRGSSQTIGIVSDVGLFLRALAHQLIGSF